MNDVYYIQVQARRIAKCIYPESLPKGIVFPEYLRGLSEECFWNAVCELRDIFRNYYSRAEKDPASLNLPLVDIEKYKSTSGETRNGYHALLNFPAALLSFASCACLDENTLRAEISEVRKFFTSIRRKYLPEQLKLLSEYGFEFGGFDGTKLPKKGTLTVTYPDNAAVIIVLAAMGDKFSKFFPYLQTQPKTGMHLEALEQFIFVTPGVFADNTEILPPKTLEHMAAVVGKENSDMLLKTVERFEKRGLTFWIDTAFLKNRFYNQKGNDTLTHIEYGDYKSIYPFTNEKMILRLKLNNPDAYKDKIENLPPNLYRAFNDIWCNECSETCRLKITYHLKNEEKHACGCFFFGYEPQSVAELDLLMELYDLEQISRTKKHSKH